MGIAKTDLPGTRAEWQALAGSLRLRNQAFIDGRYVDAASGKRFDCVSPIDGRVLTQVSECGPEDVERAVAAARRAFDQGSWSNASPVERKRKLLQLARLLEQNAIEFALLETLDMGKPIGDSVSFDVQASLRCFEWTAEAIDKVFDQIAPTGQNELGMITHEPLGVVAAIVPWNFPLLMAAWKVAPALAMGNSVLLKPSEKSPLSALRLAELVAEAGIPDGVFNVLPGFGQGCGEAMALHMDVDGLVFTGSTAV
ncbi:MAG: aldehyde dehydrogenase family protein, partial [Arenimonas sp.]